MECLEHVYSIRENEENKEQENLHMSISLHMEKSADYSDSCNIVGVVG